MLNNCIRISRVFKTENSWVKHETFWSFNCTTENHNAEHENRDECNFLKTFNGRKVVKCLLDLELLIYFQPMSHFYTPLKNIRKGFLMFSGGVEGEHWLKMG